MELKQLEIFCAVVERGGFTLAAEKLGVAQPTVSFQIALLEEELGLRILDRGGRKTVPTRGGDVLYRYAREILAMTQEAEQAIHSLKGLLWGEVSLGASTIPGEYILPPILHKFREGHPGIEISMTIDDSSGVIKKVLADEVEVGVVGATEKNDKLAFIRFVSDTLVLIAPAHNSWFATDQATIEELRKVPFVSREHGSGTRTIAEQKLREVGVDNLNISMTLGSTEAAKRAVESGAGVAIVSERAVQNEVKMGLLKAMTIEGLELSRDFYIVHRKQKVLSPAAEALIQFLQGVYERAK